MNICELLENSDTQLNQNENEVPLAEEPAMNIKKDTLILSGVPTSNCESSTDSIESEICTDSSDLNKKEDFDQISNETPANDENDASSQMQTNMNAESSLSSQGDVDDDNNEEDNNDYNSKTFKSLLI